MSLPQNLALPVVFAIGALLIGWYLVANEVMRRRGRSLAVWCKRSLDPLGGRQAIQWITTQSFRLEVEGLKAPLGSGTLPGLVQSLAVPVILLPISASGRRAMVIFHVCLLQPPICGFALYRPPSVLA